MLYEVCYRALLSISVVEATHDGRAPPPCAMAEMAAGCAPAAGARATLDHRITPRTDVHPQDSLAGGPPARWFVIQSIGLEKTMEGQHRCTTRDSRSVLVVEIREVCGTLREV